MDAKRFINILKRHKYTLIGVPFLVIAIAFVLVRNLPDVYTSKATISAGLADQSQQLLADKADLAQEKTNQAFVNLIQMMQMRNVYDQVGYQLIFHDLTSSSPYHKPSKLLLTLNADARKHALDVYAEMYKNRQQLNLADKDQRGLQDVLASEKYDYGSLARKLKIYRIENSDFVTVEFDSESPFLSAAVVNTLCKEFIDYYTTLTKENELKSINYLGKLLEVKKDTLNNKLQELKEFKIKNNVLNLNEEAKGVYTQIAAYEDMLESVQKGIDANEGALRSIDNKFNSGNRQYIMDGKTTMLNQDIIQTQQQLDQLNEAYVRSNFDTSYLSKIQEQKRVLNEEIGQANDKAMLNPMLAKENLATQKMNLEIGQEQAKSSIPDIKNQLEVLNRKFEKLVPNQATVTGLEGEITVASQEYMAVLNKYNEASLQYNNAIKLKLLESGSIGELQPSKKLLLIVLSGIVSFIFCVMVLFILFYLDNSVQLPSELADKTGVPVLGHLPAIPNISFQDMAQFWKSNQFAPSAGDFKNQLRSVRFEIDNYLKGPSILNITSLTAGEGKSTLAMSLATAYMMMGRRVLLIDGNFNSPAITEMADTHNTIENYLTGNINMPFPSESNGVFVLGNKGMDMSLFEVMDEDVVMARMNVLKHEFDIILVESSSLDTMNMAKEWNKIADRIVSVFEYGKTISAEEKEEIKYLQSTDNKYIGWVMNKVPGQVTAAPKRRWSFRRKA